MLDRFRAARPNQQLQIVLAAVCLLSIVFVLVWLLMRTTYQPLFKDLRASDAATIVAELDRKKIPYRLADGGATILVPSDAVDATRLGVMSDDAPLKGTVGFELFNKSDMGLTDFAQKINYQRALQGELARTIMTLDGVDTARVHLSLGEDRLFRDDQVAPKASVTIRMSKGATLSESVAQGVKRLVAAAVPKLNVADVVILDESGQLVSSPAPYTAPASLGSPMLEERRAIEEYYEGKIREALAGANLAENMAVGVSAETVINASGAQSGSGLATWSPNTRDFPLQITLSPRVPLASDAQDRLRTLVAKAVVSTNVQDDAVIFGTTVPDVASGEVDTSRPISEKHALGPLPQINTGDDERSQSFGWAFVAVPILVVLFAAFVLLRKLRSPRRLSKRRQEEFLLRLRTVLKEGGGHVASSS